jgi:ABC-type polysaccharide/polyol phosphate export permease
MVPEGWARTLLALNPMAPILDSYRRVVWGTKAIPHGTAPDFVALGAVFLLSLVLAATAIVGFKRAEPAFARIL